MSKEQTNKWSRILKTENVFWLLLVITLGISIQQYLLPDREFWGAIRPQYNNYLIFKYSFIHLVQGLNLYDYYPEHYGDLFKYSPSFAFFMGLFYYLPDWLGLTLWNLLNAFCLYAGVRSLPHLKDKTKVFILLYVVFELIGNIQNEQSNAMMAGLIMLAFSSFEKKKLMLAALFVVLSVYIKIFGIIAAVLFVMYRGKFKFMSWMFIWGVVILILPIIFISPLDLFLQYQHWLDVILSDHQARYGFSVLGILYKWIDFTPEKSYVLAIGLGLLCVPLIRREHFQTYQYRLLFVSSMLMWVILFNHTAESSGYILALTGCAIWYFSQPKTNYKTVLIILAFLLVSMFSTDLMPAHIRNTYIYPYYIRTLPVLIIWGTVLYEMMFNQFSPETTDRLSD